MGGHIILNVAHFLKIVEKEEEKKLLLVFSFNNFIER